MRLFPASQLSFGEFVLKTLDKKKHFVKKVNLAENIQALSNLSWFSYSLNPMHRSAEPYQSGCGEGYGS